MNKPYLLFLHLHFLPCPPHLPLPQCHYLPLHYQYHLLNPSYFHHCFLKKRRENIYLMQTDRQNRYQSPNKATMDEVNSQISTVVSKLPIGRAAPGKHGSGLIHTQAMKRSKTRNSQGKGDKWPQTHLYQPSEGKSETWKQKGARLPVSLRSTGHCFLPLPRAAFLLISSSWLSSSMAGHGSPRRAAEAGRQRSTHGGRAGTGQAQQTPECERGHGSSTPLSIFPASVQGGYNPETVRLRSPAELDETSCL